MKKHVLVLIALCSVVFWGCKKDKKPIYDPLMATWFRQYISPVTQNSVIDRYVFDAGGAFYFQTSIHDKLTNAPITFIQTTKGSYRKEGGKIIFYNLVNQIEDTYKDDYSPQGKAFVLAKTAELKYSMDTEYMALYLTSPCSPNAFCAEVAIKYNRAGID
jgi:hypothetical protein